MFRMRPLAAATKRGGSRARNSTTRSFATLPLAPRFPGLGGGGGGGGEEQGGAARPREIAIAVVSWGWSVCPRDGRPSSPRARGTARVCSCGKQRTSHLGSDPEVEEGFSSERHSLRKAGHSHLPLSGGSGRGCPGRYKAISFLIPHGKLSQRNKGTQHVL